MHIIISIRMQGSMLWPFGQANVWATALAILLLLETYTQLLVTWWSHQRHFWVCGKWWSAIILPWLCCYSDNKTTSNPDIEERRKLFEDIFSLLETQGTVSVWPPLVYNICRLDRLVNLWEPLIMLPIMLKLCTSVPMFC